MKVWLKRSLFFLALAIFAGGWIVYFHHQAVRSHLPKWKWLGAWVNQPEASPEHEEGGAGDAPDHAKDEIPVHTAKVGRATLHRYLDAIGTVSPRPARPGEMAGSANLASPVAGVVARVLCRQGQRVHANDPVIQLDDRLAQAAEAQARAALAQAEAALALLKATPRPDQLRIAELNVQKARTAFEFSRKAYDRQKLLGAEESASAKTVEQAKMELAAADIELQVNEKQLALLQSSPTPAELHQEEAKVAQAAAALATAQTQRQMLTLRSPIDAAVALISVNPGESADPTRTLVQLIAPDRLMVEVGVPADQAVGNLDGLSAEILPAAGESAAPAAPALMGKVRFVSPRVDARTGAVAVGVDVPAEAALRPGLTVRVRIVLDEHPHCLVVPREAVVEGEDGQNIVSMIGNERTDEKTGARLAHAQAKKVKTGFEENGMIEISADGIIEGSKVVAAGAFGLPAACQVKLLD